MNLPMTIPMATIVASRALDVHGLTTETYEWQGPEDGIVAISMQLLSLVPDMLERLPWQLEEIGRNDLQAWVFYKRKAEQP